MPHSEFDLWGAHAMVRTIAKPHKYRTGQKSVIPKIYKIGTARGICQQDEEVVPIKEIIFETAEAAPVRVKKPRNRYYGATKLTETP